MNWPSIRWLLQRIALLDSPLLMIAAIASLFTDRPVLGAALALLSFASYMFGRGVIGQRYPPGDPRNPDLPAPTAGRRRDPSAATGDGGTGRKGRSRMRRTPL